ncbi:MAG: hypothetical protein JXA22_05200 [Candidatus Thermoplasmatota archaeon]|nr:hypothetical protein [Candidatus Thermoplasmatota archaeon]
MECVDMGFSGTFRGHTVGVLLILAVSFVSTIPAAGQNTMVPTIEGQISLEVISGPDQNPAVLRTAIPWSTGEPVITGFSYRTDNGNWTRIEDWRTLYSSVPNCSFITFQLEMDWGVQEEVAVSLTDLMGSNSTVARMVTCSRKPVVNIDHILDNGKRPIAGMNIFVARATDPDGQKMTYHWTVDGVEASSEERMDVYLSPGEHTIGIKVNDGQWSIEDERDVTILEMEEIDVEKEIDLLNLISIAFLVICSLALMAFTIFAISTSIIQRLKGEEAGTGTEEDNIAPGDAICDICMKELKGEQKIVTCRCGARMHRGCGNREGVCPKCGREVLILSNF